jgi:tetratricopeptide (TPR) repeat protein
MFPHIRRHPIPAAALLTCVLAMAPGVSAQEEAKAEKPATTPAPTISERTGEKLNEAIEFLNNDDYASATRVLSEINLEKTSPYERSRIEQIWSGIAYAQGKPDAARDHLQKAIAAGGFNEQEVSQARYNIAQMYMAEDLWKEGVAALEEWFRTAPAPNSAAYYLLAAAYYQLEDLDRALEPAKKAVELSDKPQISWIELLLGLYLQREDYDAALPLMERLIAMEPDKKSHWLRLSSLYQTQEKYPQALAAMQVAYNAGYLETESDYVRLADMLRFNNIPFRAARVLEKAIEDGHVKGSEEVYEKLANAWLQARDFEQAIPPLKRAAGMSNNGDLYAQLGQVQIQREKWGDAVAALQDGIDKGGLKDMGNSQLLMGIALFNQKKLKDARTWFQRASSSKKHQKMAAGYIQLIDSRQS